MVKLAEARKKARRHRALVDQGVDPVTLRASAQSAAAARRSTQQSFSTVAAKYIAQHEKSWKKANHAAQRIATPTKYADPVVGPLLVSDVTTAHVIKVLDPIWTTKTETASRVRSRMERVLDFAAAHGLREGPNPARWRGNLDAALPKASKLAKVQHHAAVAAGQMRAFTTRLRAQKGVGARALEFAILTAARSGEVRRATWSELDFAHAQWTMPAHRMKADASTACRSPLQRSSCCGNCPPVSRAIWCFRAFGARCRT